MFGIKSDTRESIPNRPSEAEFVEFASDQSEGLAYSTSRQVGGRLVIRRRNTARMIQYCKEFEGSNNSRQLRRRLSEIPRPSVWGYDYA